MSKSKNTDDILHRLTSVKAQSHVKTIQNLPHGEARTKLREILDASKEDLIGDIMRDHRESKPKHQEFKNLMRDSPVHKEIVNEHTQYDVSDDGRSNSSAPSLRS